MAWWVIVCRHCWRASCAYGQIKCNRRDGLMMQISSAILPKFAEEPTAFYSREKLTMVTGKEPEEVRS